MRPLLLPALFLTLLLARWRKGWGSAQSLLRRLAAAVVTAQAGWVFLSTLFFFFSLSLSPLAGQGLAPLPRITLGPEARWFAHIPPLRVVSIRLGC